MISEVRNIAYIDGQNLHMGTAKSEPRWQIDLARLRVYLDRKYNVGRAYYYLGYVQAGANIEKILFPNRRYRSSLYKTIALNYFAFLDDAATKSKIQHKK